MAHSAASSQLHEQQFPGLSKIDWAQTVFLDQNSGYEQAFFVRGMKTNFKMTILSSQDKDKKNGS